MADYPLRAESVPAIPLFPIDYPASQPLSAPQRLLAAKADELAAWGTPPPMLDTIIELLDWYDGDAEEELFDPDLEDCEGTGHDPHANMRAHIQAGDPAFAMPGDYADNFN